VAEEEDEEEEAEVEEVGEGEDADAPKGKLKQLPGDYRFAREQDCDLRLFDSGCTRAHPEGVSKGLGQSLVFGTHCVA